MRLVLSLLLLAACGMAASIALSRPLEPERALPFLRINLHHIEANIPIYKDPKGNFLAIDEFSAEAPAGAEESVYHHFESRCSVVIHNDGEHPVRISRGTLHSTLVLSTVRCGASELHWSTTAHRSPPGLEADLNLLVPARGELKAEIRLSAVLAPIKLDLKLQPSQPTWYHLRQRQPVAGAGKGSFEVWTPDYQLLGRTEVDLRTVEDAQVRWYSRRAIPEHRSR